MKHAISILILSGALSMPNLWAYESFDIININNYGPSGNPIYYPEGMLLPAENSYVQLFSLGYKVYLYNSGQSIFALTEDGFFYGGIGVVPGVNSDGDALFELRAWTGAPTWDTALHKGKVIWIQKTVLWSPDSIPPVPPSGPDLENPILILIPEPSTTILGVIGGAAMLLSRRKAF